MKFFHNLLNELIRNFSSIQQFAVDGTNHNSVTHFHWQTCFYMFQFKVLYLDGCLYATEWMCWSGSKHAVRLVFYECRSTFEKGVHQSASYIKLKWQAFTVFKQGHGVNRFFQSRKPNSVVTAASPVICFLILHGTYEIYNDEDYM